MKHYVYVILRLNTVFRNISYLPIVWTTSYENVLAPFAASLYKRTQQLLTYFALKWHFAEDYDIRVTKGKRVLLNRMYTILKYSDYYETPKMISQTKLKMYVRYIFSMKQIK